MNSLYKDSIVTAEFLKDNPDQIFVFGDNTLRKGKKGAAIHRDRKNAWGFITKKIPSYNPDAYYKPREYKKVFDRELSKLMDEIEKNPQNTYLISRLGSGLANRFNIWEEVICEGLQVLDRYENVRFLYTK